MQCKNCGYELQENEPRCPICGEEFNWAEYKEKLQQEEEARKQKEREQQEQQRRQEELKRREEQRRQEELQKQEQLRRRKELARQEKQQTNETEEQRQSGQKTEEQTRPDHRQNQPKKSTVQNGGTRSGQSADQNHRSENHSNSQSKSNSKKQSGIQAKYAVPAAVLVIVGMAACYALGKGNSANTDSALLNSSSAAAPAQQEGTAAEAYETGDEDQESAAEMDADTAEEQTESAEGADNESGDEPTAAENQTVAVEPKVITAEEAQGQKKQTEAAPETVKKSSNTTKKKKSTQSAAVTAAPEPEEETITVVGGIQAPVSDFIFPYSSTSLLSDSELNNVLYSSDESVRKSKSQLAVNEIFARYGYVFQSDSATAQDARNQFNDKDWYQQARDESPSPYDWNVLHANYLNDVEKENIKRINAWQSRYVHS